MGHAVWSSDGRNWRGAACQTPAHLCCNMCADTREKGWGIGSLWASRLLSPTWETRDTCPNVPGTAPPTCIPQKPLPFWFGSPPPPPHFAKSAIIGTVWPAEIKRTANCNQPLKTPKFPTALQSLHRPREEIPFRQRKELSPSYRIIL